MAIEYFCCYHSYRKKCEKLTDQELGRLFRALLEYSETGETQELAGRESIAFDFIADDIDRAKEVYAEKCRRNSENGKAGGRPKNPKNQTVFSETQKSQNKNKDKDKDKNKDEDKKPPTPLEGASPSLQDAFGEWLRYKQERREGYKPAGLQALQTEVLNNARVYGDEAVAQLIRTCMASNWKGIIFDRLAAGNRQGFVKAAAAPQAPARVDSTDMDRMLKDLEIAAGCSKTWGLQPGGHQRPTD